jgi:hypothetical protein
MTTHTVIATSTATSKQAMMSRAVHDVSLPKSECPLSRELISVSLDWLLQAAEEMIEAPG